MSKFRPWAFWRRLKYGFGFASFWSVIGVLIWFVNFYEPANCFDGMHNGVESGVDCGGNCVRICSATVLPPRLVWTESFKITNGQYNAVAYVENNNQIAATTELKYTFQLLDKGTVVAERSGTTILPPNSVYPIFEGRIFTENLAEVTETNIVLETVDVWQPASVGRDQFRSLDISLTGADSRPRLDVVIENTEVTPASDIEVVATIFNENGDPVASSQTFIEQISPRATTDIVFTWPNSIAKTVKSCVVPTDVVVGIDLSGSMNNDGSNPPQPVTDALAAASTFVSSLKDEDQVSVVTFATQAQVTTQLTNLTAPVATEIKGLTISPREETGYTNTGAALETARAELNSFRHNGNARRVLVLLTDGLPTAQGDDDVINKAVATAESLDEEGIEVFAIGLGTNVDATFIAQLASDESNSFIAPTGADLDAIYAEITSSLCESGPTKIDVIAKTRTNFTPLR